MSVMSQNKKSKADKKANSGIGFYDRFYEIGLKLSGWLYGPCFLAWAEKFHVHLARHP